MRLFILIITSFFVITGCKKKEPTTWNVDIKAPILETSLSLANILTDTILAVQTDNRLHINYSYNFSAIQDSGIFNAPDTSITDTHFLALPSSINVNPGFQFANTPEESKFNYGDARVHEMRLNKGKVKYKIVSQINEKTIYRYRILRSDDGMGNELSESIVVPAGTISNPGIAEGEFDIAGYSFDMKGSDGNDYNVLETSVIVQIDPDGSTVEISKHDSIFIENRLTDIEPSYVKGYLGTSSVYDPNGNTNFDVLKKIIDGSLDINELDISMDLENYVGAEVRFKLNRFSSINSNTNNHVDLSHSIIGNPVNVNRATLIGGVEPSPYIASYLMDENNSNIDLFFENLPDKLEYDFEASINPLGNVSGYNDFLFFDKAFNFSFNVNLPLSLIASNLTLIDTLNLNIDSISNLNSGKFELLITNGFPFDAHIQLYLLDENLNIQDSLIEVNTLASSASLNAFNIVNEPTNSTIQIDLTKEKIDLLQNSPKIILKATYNTQGVGHVDLYDHHKLDIKIIGDFNYKAKLN